MQKSLKTGNPGCGSQEILHARHIGFLVDRPGSPVRGTSGAMVDLRDPPDRSLQAFAIAQTAVHDLERGTRNVPKIVPGSCQDTDSVAPRGQHLRQPAAKKSAGACHQDCHEPLLSQLPERVEREFQVLFGVRRRYAQP